MNGEDVEEHPLEASKRELDKILPKVTPEAVCKAMEGFPLPLAGGWDITRLATVVRRVLACTPRPERRLINGHRESPYVIERDSVKRMAETTANAAQMLMGVEWSIRGRIMTLGLIPGSINIQKDDAFPPMKRYENIVSELEWLSSFLAVVASSISKPAPKWEMAADREWRINVGWGLATVYEVAFGHRPTANKSASGITPFMTFFQRMMKLAFELGHGGPDFKAITIAACQQHRDEPAACGWLLNP